MTGTIHQHPSVYSPDEAPQPPGPEGWELRHVDPATVLDNPDNARRPERDREGLAASIAALGILTPPLVRNSDTGELVLIAGERRKYSAMAAGLATIPVYVRNDLSAVHQVAGMLVENIGRDDLTPVEEAVAIQQLAGFDGVTQKDITAMTGIKAGKVRQALIVARSEVATEVAGRYDLTLDQAAVVAEFGDDPEAVKLLTAAAVKQPEQWPHVVSRLRQERQDRQRYQAAVAELTATGCPVIELEAGYWLPEGARWLDELPPVKNKPVTEAKHRGCPGHAAAVTSPTTTATRSPTSASIPSPTATSPSIRVTLKPLVRRVRPKPRVDGPRSRRPSVARWWRTTKRGIRPNWCAVPSWPTCSTAGRPPRARSGSSPRCSSWTRPWPPQGTTGTSTGSWATTSRHRGTGGHDRPPRPFWSSPRRTPGSPCSSWPRWQRASRPPPAVRRGGHPATVWPGTWASWSPSATASPRWSAWSSPRRWPHRLPEPLHNRI